MASAITQYVRVAGKYLKIKYATFDLNTATADGTNSIIAAVAGKEIAVLAYDINIGGAAVFFFVDGSAGAQLQDSKFNLTANSAVIKDLWNGAGGELVPHLSTTSGTGLFLNSSAVVRITGNVTYVEW